MKTAIYATAIVSTITAGLAFAQPSPPQSPPRATAQQPVHPSEADYAKAQVQVLLETVQRLTPQMVEARAQISALETQLEQERARAADLEHKLADGTKSTPDKPVNFDKPAASPAAPPAAPADKAK